MAHEDKLDKKEERGKVVNEQILNWMRDNHSKGYEIGYLKDQLMQQGHPAADVEEAVGVLISEAASAPVAQAPPITIKREKIRRERTPEEKEKRKKLMWLVGGAALIVFILLLVLLFWPRQVIPAPVMNQTPVKEKSETGIDFSNPDNFTYITNTNGNMILHERGDVPITLTATSAGNVDVKNQQSHIETKINLRSKGLGNLDLQISSFLDKSNLYQHLVSLGSYNEWVKMDSSTDPYTLSRLGLNTESFDVQGDLGNELKGADPSKITAIDLKEKHFKYAPDETVVANIAQKMFWKVIGLSPEIKDTFRVNSFTYDFTTAIKEINLEYWLDENDRLKKVQTNVIFFFDKDSVKKKANGAPAGFTFDANITMVTDFNNYNSVSTAIIMPPQRLNAKTIDEFFVTTK